MRWRTPLTARGFASRVPPSGAPPRERSVSATGLWLAWQPEAGSLAGRGFAREVGCGCCAVSGCAGAALDCQGGSVVSRPPRRTPRSARERDRGCGAASRCTGTALDCRRGVAGRLPSRCRVSTAGDRCRGLPPGGRAGGVGAREGRGVRVDPETDWPRRSLSWESAVYAQVRPSLPGSGAVRFVWTRSTGRTPWCRGSPVRGRRRLAPLPLCRGWAPGSWC